MLPAFLGLHSVPPRGAQTTIPRPRPKLEQDSGRFPCVSNQWPSNFVPFEGFLVEVYPKSQALWNLKLAILARVLFL
jgi:hypothetical protein